MASLDHAMWFHRPFRADEWLLYDQDTPSASGGPRPRARQHLHPRRPPRRHRGAGGPDPGGARVRRAAPPRWRPSLLLGACTDDEPAEPPSTVVHDDAPRPATPPSSTAPPAEATLDTIELAHPGHRHARRTHRAGGPARLTRPVHRREGRPGPPDQGARRTEFGDDEGELTYELQTTPLLDISDEVINEGERGLLGMTFSSDGRKLYLDYTRQPDGHTVVVEYTLGDGARIDDDSRREILVVEQPYANHNGGQLAIGPDGYLYVAPRRRRRRRRPARARAGHLDAARLDPAHRPRERDRGRARLRHPARQPLRRRRGRRTRDLALRRAQPVAVQLRHRDRRPLGRRRGPGRVRGDQPPPGQRRLRRRQGRQPRLGGDGGHPLRSKAARTPTGAVLPIFEYGRDARLLGHRRLRVPRRGDPRAPGHLPLHRLLRHRRARPPGRRRHGDRHPTWDLPLERRLLLRPGRRRRALRAPRRRPRREARAPDRRGPEAASAIAALPPLPRARSLDGSWAASSPLCSPSRCWPPAPRRPTREPATGTRRPCHDDPPRLATTTTTAAPTTDRRPTAPAGDRPVRARAPRRGADHPRGWPSRSRPPREPFATPNASELDTARAGLLQQVAYRKLGAPPRVGRGRRRRAARAPAERRPAARRRPPRVPRHAHQAVEHPPGLAHRRAGPRRRPPAGVPGRGGGVRHPVEVPGRHQPRRDGHRPHPGHVDRGRAGTDAVHARHLGGLRRRRATSTTPATRSEARRATWPPTTAPSDIAHALYRYNHSNRYVRGVQIYADLIAEHPRAFLGFYHWGIWYLTDQGEVYLPVGYEQSAPIPVAELHDSAGRRATVHVPHPVTKRRRSRAGARRRARVRSIGGLSR